jgi:hypothetical protein
VNKLEHMIQYETKPNHGEIVVAWRPDGRRDMVQIHRDKAFLWRYRLTDDVFCDVDEITKWRGCTGFDF